MRGSPPPERAHHVRGGEHVFSLMTGIEHESDNPRCISKNGSLRNVESAYFDQKLRLLTGSRTKTETVVSYEETYPEKYLIGVKRDLSCYRFLF